MRENTLDRFVRLSLDTGIRRREQQRWVAGVCIGLGARYHIDPVMFRAGFLLMTLFGGISIPVYLLCWLLLPAHDDTVALERALRGADGTAITLLVVTVIAVVGTLMPLGEGRGSLLMGLIVMACLVFFLGKGIDGPWRDRPATAAAHDGVPTGLGAAGSTTPASTPSGQVASAGEATEATLPRPGDVYPPLINPLRGEPQDTLRRPAPSPALPTPTPGITMSPTGADAGRRRTSWLVTLVTAGLAILTYLGIDALPFDADQRWMVPLAGSLAVIGSALVTTAFTRHRPPLVTAAAWIVAISLLASQGGGHDTDAGDMVWRPTDVQSLQGEYEMSAGDAVLDLTAVPVGEARHHVTVSYGVGDVEIRLPANARAEVRGRLGLGSLHVDEGGDHREVASGGGIDHPVTVGTGPEVYVIDVDGGVGEITVHVTDTTAPTTQEASR